MSAFAAFIASSVHHTALPLAIYLARLLWASSCSLRIRALSASVSCLACAAAAWAHHLTSQPQKVCISSQAAESSCFATLTIVVTPRSGGRCYDR